MMMNAMSRPWLAALGLCLLVAGCGSASSTFAVRDKRLSGQQRQQLAATAEASGNEQLALSMYQKAAVAAPGDGNAQLNYADILVRTGQITEARSVLNASLGRVSDPIDVERALGTLDVLTGHSAEGLQELGQVLARNPNDVRALANRGVGLDLLGKHGEAQAVYRQALALSPDDPAITNNLALSYALEGQIDAARRVLEPYVGQKGLPQRMQVTMRLLMQRSVADKSAPTPDEARLNQLRVALATQVSGMSR